MDWLLEPRSILSRGVPIAVWCLFAATPDVVPAQELRALGPLDAGRITYFIAPPPPDPASRPGDRDLARWALDAWQRAAAGRFTFVPAESEADALVRVYWAPAAGGQYGEMRALDVAGRRGAAVFVRPDTAALGEPIAVRATLDALFRDTIVYLTCLHELGHALGLGHTDDFADVMYFFGFGGDIPEFFDRYRRSLATRADIALVSGLSANDIRTLHGLYREPVAPLQVRNAN
jgi:hypothetical protein